MATKKRRLSDLYVTGRMAYINDESGGEPVQIWLQKLNAVEAETVARKANAARARTLIAGRNKETDEWHEVYSEVSDLDTDTIISIVIADDVVRKARAAEAELAAQDEWSNDEYLQGLRDAWNDGLRKIYEDGDEAAEDYQKAKETFEELKRFTDALDKRVEAERENLRRDAAELSVDQLVEQAVARHIALRGDGAWVKEFRRSMLYFGTRDPENPKQRYFETRDDLDDLSGPTLDALYREYEKLNVEVTEGKSLPPTPDSSQQSEQDAEGETADSSGPVAVSQ